MTPFLLFDLDGTLSDPLDGIARSINYALAAHGYDTHPEASFAQFIGPPLDDTFRELTGSPDEAHIRELVASFRERFGETGYKENRLYPGVRDALEQLREKGVSLAVCTSKRTDFAEKIIAMFGLDHLMAFVNGGDIGIRKVKQIADLLAKGLIPGHTIMIGDRYVDLRAAHNNGLASAGVLWGYGSREELAAEHPAWLLDAPGEWLKLICRNT